MKWSADEFQRLIQRAQNADQAAIGELYEYYVDAIYRYIAYRVPEQADAEDLTAEVFVKMVEALPTYRLTGAPFESWLYRIAATRVANWHRNAYRHPQDALSDSLTTGEALPEDDLQRHQELEALRAALQKLSEEHRMVLMLRFVERKSHEEVAVLLSKSVTAVKTIQHRALQRLALLLGSDSKTRHYLRGEQDE